MTVRPTFSECVIGYRMWRLAGWVLAPQSVGDPWRPGVNVAECRKREAPFWPSNADGLSHPGPSPTVGCTCGLHAFHEVPDITTRTPWVCGAIAAWGDLQVHSNGFRAQYAQIVALAEAEPPLQKGWLDDLGRLYGVPVVPVSLLSAEAQRHGTPLPLDFRPPPERPPEPRHSLQSQWQRSQWLSNYPGARFPAPSAAQYQPPK